MRRRYRLARWASVAVGGLAAAVAIAVALDGLAIRQLAPGVAFYALALMVLVLGLGVPWLITKSLWLWRRRRNDWGR